MLAIDGGEYGDIRYGSRALGATGVGENLRTAYMVAESKKANPEELA